MPPPSETSRRRRVPALAPDERRAALIDATVPLLRVHGTAVSTRQIAQAAGVAEGTIFGVFPDKSSLVDAALVHALDPAPAVQALAELASIRHLRTRLAMAATVMTSRMRDHAPLMMAARERFTAADGPDALRCRFGESREQMLTALTTLIEPDAAMLRRSPATVARLLLVLVGTAAHGMFGEIEQLSGDEIVSLLLDGMLRQPSDTTTTDGGTARC